MSAEYYDSRFRKSLLELLSSCRKMLQQIELSSTDKYYNFFITDTIKKVDKAYKIVRPSRFDFLSEGKLEKLQADEFLKQKADELDQKLQSVRKDVADELRKKIEKEMLQQYKEKLTEEIQKQVIKEYREQLTEKIRTELIPIMQEEIIREYQEKLTAEIRAELTPIIKEECKQERKLKKARKRAKTLELIQNEILNISPETQTKTSDDNANEKNPPQNIEVDNIENDTDEDEFDVAPEPDIDNIE